jgi:hypothetical protein
MDSFPAVGSAVPHVTIATTNGRRVEYAELWQRKQLMLVIVPEARNAVWTAFEQQLEAARAQFEALETALVVSRDRVRGVDRPLACAADRWGEVTHIAPLEAGGGFVMPELDTLLLWAEATLHRCPECEGEAR